MPKHSSIIGVDLGGTKIALARYDVDTLIMEEKNTLSTHADKHFDYVLGGMIAAIEELRTEGTTGVGIGVPGLVQQPEGIVLTLPNIPGSTNIPLQQLLSDTLNLRVVIDNDANCFTLAEALQGAGKNDDVVVGVTMGTGVGGGIVIGGTLFHGQHGYAAELGHMLLRPGQPPYDTKDMRGDVEQFFSGNALHKRCSEAKNADELLEGETCSFLHKDIATEIAWMCTNLIHLLDPGIIVFGGSAGRALKSHIPDIEKELQKWLLPGTPIPKIAIASLEDSAVLGAALLVCT